MSMIDITQFLVDLVERNKLLTAWPEINAIRELPLKLTTNEKSGHVTCRMTKGKYEFQITFLISDGYPVETPTWKIGDSNFPLKILRLFEGQAMNLLRHLTDKVQNESAPESTRRPPTVDELHQIRHDLKFLKV